MGKAKFDGSLESAVAAVDAVLEENPRSSGRQVREALAAVKVDIPTVGAEEFVSNDDGSVVFGGVTYLPADAVGAGAQVVEDRLAVEEAARVKAEARVAELEAAAAAQPGPVTVDALAGSTALLEAADKLDEKPLVRTTNGQVARWLRSL